jgi:hypothetical protein
MVLHKIEINTSPLKILDIVLSKEGPNFFRDAKPYATYYRGLNWMKSSWGMLQTMDLEHLRPCCIRFDIKKKWRMRIHGTMTMNRHTAVFAYRVETWIPLYKRAVEKRMIRAIEDIRCISSNSNCSK